jgi:hypothetical protein
MNKLITIISLAALTVAAFAQSGEKLGLRPYNWKPQAQSSEKLGSRLHNLKSQSQFRAQSLDVKTSSDGVSVLWLRDCLSTNYTAFAVPMFQVTGLGNRVSIVGLGAYDSNFTRTNVWAGTGVSVSLVETSGWSVKAYGGWKGFNLGNNFNAAQGKEAFVYGIGFSVPIR